MKSAAVVRPIEANDAAGWRAMRTALWPDEGGHEDEVARFFTGTSRNPVAVLVAEEPGARLVGFAELSIRPYAEGSRTDRVAFLEGWYVAPDVRRRGIGRALVAAAEDWARTQGCEELGSDAEASNIASAAAHRALGFEDLGLIRCFLKEL